MKKLLITTLLLFPFLALAQFSNDAPWMQQSNDARNTDELTLSEISARANTFFNQIDTDKKGSGYKPFKRSEYHWNFYVEPNGKIAKADKLWQAWEQKKGLSRQALQNRSVQVVSDWHPMGPYSFINSGSWSEGQGRVNVVVVDPVNPNIYYLGAPAGGLWVTKDSGLSWTPLTDNLPQIGVSGIAIDPTDTNIIYITTGDDDAGDSYFVGVKKSIDGGATWNDTGSIAGNSANEIYIDPTDTNIIWVATSSGLFKSVDAGSTWVNKRSGNIKDFKLKPGDPNTIYAVTSNNFYRSADGGATFTQITDGFPNSSSRLTIDITPANAELVYVLSASSGNFQGIYKSTDSGVSFTKTNEINDIFDGSGQSWYDMALGVSDSDENTLFVGVLNVWKSTDGGDSFVRINEWNNASGAAYTHADIHFLRYHNGALFAGTDGGVYRSADDGTNFSSITTGLAISQFYKISVSKESSAYMAGGLQDNGGFAYSNGQWYNYHGADGMDAAVDPNNKEISYGFIQNGGSLYKATNGGQSASSVTGAPSGETGNWVTPLVMKNDGTLLAGYNKLYSLNGTSWQIVVPQTFGGRLNVIESDPNDNSIIYISRGLSLYKKTSQGTFFETIDFSFSGNSISSIEVHNSDSNIIWLTTNGSSGKVYKSIDGGVSWTDITGNLPSESKNVIRHQNHNPNNPIYVGTSLGVYYKDDTLSDWQVFSTNLPNVSITDLEVNYNDTTITASTYGRGIWQSAIPVVYPDNEVRLVNIETPNSGIQCGDVTPSVLVKNEGVNTISNLTINYRLDGSPYTQDWTGSIASGDSETIDLDTFSLARGTYDLDVQIVLANDTYDDNNNAASFFIVNDNDPTPTVVNSFEDTLTDSWLVNIEPDSFLQLWQIAEPSTTLLNTVATGTKAYITSPMGNYPDNTIGNLITPCYDLTSISNPIMSFKMSFDIEVDWDVLYMQYSIDNGTSWHVLGTADDPNWYNNTYSEHALTIGGQWSGTIAALTEYTYDLSAFTNEPNIMFRFHFASDQNTTGEGALIDDFVIMGETVGLDDYLAQSIQLFPNPTEGLFTINWFNDESVQVRVFSITGKELLFDKLEANSQKTIDLSNYANGIYLVNFQTQQHTLTKKVILN